MDDIKTMKYLLREIEKAMYERRNPSNKYEDLSKKNAAVERNIITLRSILLDVKKELK